MPRGPRSWGTARCSPRAYVKAELGCPENTEVRCPLFTDPRVPESRLGTDLLGFAGAIGGPALTTEQPGLLLLP
jgi:hypothetical protein